MVYYIFGIFGRVGRLFVYICWFFLVVRIVLGVGRFWGLAILFFCEVRGWMEGGMGIVFRF